MVWVETAGAREDWPGVAPPPRPFPAPLFLYHFLRNPLRCLPDAVYEEPIVPYESGPVRIAWVTDPDLVETVFLHKHDVFPKPPLEQRVFAEPLGQSILTSQGAEWRWQRRAVSDLFRHRDLLSYVPSMSAAAAALLERWRAGGESGVRSVDRDVTATTYDAISRTLFGGEAAPEAGQIQAAVSAYLNNITWEIVAALVGAPEWAWHPGRPHLRRAGRQMRRAVESLLDRWAATDGADGPHLLGHLLSAEEPGGDGAISRTRIINNLLTFLNAGHETTAKALTWALYVLAREPDWQERVREEVAAVAGDAPIDGAHIDRLVLTRQVFDESMRLYAPAPVLTRVALETSVLGPCRIEAGTLIFVPIWAIHRHRRLWERPDAFDPERFAPERRTSYRRTQFMPFGFGPRICIGSSFATIEGVAMLATLLREARFAWDGRHVPEPLSRVTLWPRGGMPLRVEMIGNARGE
jgi:cytochrome P450